MEQPTVNENTEPLSDADLKELESLNCKVDNISNDIREIVVGLQAILTYLSDKPSESSLGLSDHTGIN